VREEEPDRNDKEENTGRKEGRTNHSNNGRSIEDTNDFEQIQKAGKEKK
jgi:hypothetical protein